MLFLCFTFLTKAVLAWDSTSIIMHALSRLPKSMDNKEQVNMLNHYGNTSLAQNNKLELKLMIDTQDTNMMNTICSSCWPQWKCLALLGKLVESIVM